MSLDSRNAGRNFRIRTDRTKLFSVIPRLVVTLPAQQTMEANNSQSEPYDVIVPLATSTGNVQQNGQMSHIQGHVAWLDQDSNIPGNNPHFPIKVDMTQAYRMRIIMSKVAPANTKTSKNALDAIPPLDASVTDSNINVALTGGNGVVSLGYQGAFATPVTTMFQGRLLAGPTTFIDALTGLQTTDFFGTSEIWIAKNGEIGNSPSPPDELVSASTAGDLYTNGTIFFNTMYNTQGLTLGITV